MNLFRRKSHTFTLYKHITNTLLLHLEREGERIYKKATAVDTNRNTNWFKYLVESFYTMALFIELSERRAIE